MKLTKTIFSLILAILLVIVAFAVVACNNQTESDGEKPPVTGDETDPSDEEDQNVPVYTGMTASNAIASPANLLPQAVVYSDMGIQTVAEEEYRAGKNEDVFITIHFDNPKNFEILSFTVNNKKYSSYMFEYGSNMENIIIKENMGNADLNVEFTIDAIKYIDGEEIKDVKIGGNQTIKVMVEYDINYHLSGGDKGDNPSRYIMSEEITLTEATKTGYTFKGWFEDEKFIKPFSKIERYSSGDVDVYAKWEVIVYTITYHLDGGINGENPDTYTVEDEKNLLKPEKTYYTFEGWYTDSGFTEKITEVTKGMHKDLDLYAKWAYGTEGLVYELNDNVYYVTAYQGTSNDIAIPDEWNGLPVTAIDSWLFLDNTKINSVIIGNNIEGLSMAVFSGCSSLTSITIGSGVKSVYGNVFSGCENLSAVNIVDLANWCKIDFSRVYSNPLYYAHNLYLNGELVKDVVIPEGVTMLRGTFTGCSLTSITIPSSVTSIYNEAFQFSNFESITVAKDNTVYHSETDCLIETATNTLVLGCKKSVIPDYITKIGRDAFYGRTELTSIEIPASVTEIANGAFYYVRDLERITVAQGNTKFRSEGNCLIQLGEENDTIILGCKNSVIPSSVRFIAGCAFFGNSGIKSIKIPSNIIDIGMFSTFAYCENLEHIELSDGMNSIPQDAFKFCSSLKSIVIPTSIKGIHTMAFDGCSALEYIFYKGMPEQWELISEDSVCYSVVIPLTSASLNRTQYRDATVYFFSEEYPFVGDITDGDYWHYGEDGKPEIWTKRV